MPDRIFMRSIQLHLFIQKFKFSNPINLVEHLKWWLQRVNTLKARSLQQWETTVTLTTDTLNQCFGGSEKRNIMGTWSGKEKSLHINHLELEAVYKSILHFLSYLKNMKVLIRCKNITVVHQQNGGNKIPYSMSENMETIEIN